MIRDESLVSVIVPVYNYGHYLTEAIESILQQSHSDWECVIVDDGSTDTTPETVRRIAATDERIRYVRQDNLGPSAARNLGVLSSRGRMIQFLDADDRLQSEKLRIHAGCLASHEDIDIVYGAARFFTSESPDHLMFSLDGRLDRSAMPLISGPGEKVLRHLLDRNIMPICAPLFRREALERAGGFNPDIRGSEDWDLLIRCAIAGCHFQFVEAPETYCLVRAHGTSSSQDYRRMLEGVIVAGEHFRKSRVWPDWKRLHGEHLPPLYIGARGLRSIDQRRRFEAFRHFVSAARHAGTLRGRARWILLAVGALTLSRERLQRLAATAVSEKMRGSWNQLTRALRRRRKESR